MNYVWNYDGVTIPACMSIVADVAGVVIHGTAFNTRGDHVTWQAYATPQGYHVTVIERTGRVTGGHPGGTYNMALEVAAQVKHAIGSGRRSDKPVT